MKAVALLIAYLALGSLLATAQGPVVTSMLRYVSTGQADPVVHLARSMTAGSFTTNMGSSISRYVGGPFSAGESQAVDWDLRQNSDIETTPNSLLVEGKAELTTSGSVFSNGSSGFVFWDDTNRVDLKFTSSQPCEFTLSVASNSSQDPGPSINGINCYASVSGGPSVAANNFYIIGCRPPYTWPSPVAATNTISGILPAGNYRFLAVLEENEGVSAIPDPEDQQGPFPCGVDCPSKGGLGCSGILSYSFSVKYPVFSPNIINHRIEGSTAILEFLTRTNTPCYVEFSDTLNATQWLALPPINGTGGSITVTNSLPVTGSRFYRVRSGN